MQTGAIIVDRRLLGRLSGADCYGFAGLGLTTV